ncbi:TonB-dependent receptor [Undibacterium sp. RTI2.1]|uniref:TonB-dependent receptor n=1 Tax=unclassified Undibacterium TaxID=2630295 RepID=UPI002AB5752E|nr:MULTISPECIES: TonB-dependent receptor [unclassified Undibacterium]MDY7538965.1 TonB-dependent receptor [Undibacterium sp. 5I1]MEB0031384.1 TonB-dependent receptor [Undibacterium sp. RTI2.1]MEB0117640.1 TonB-dependent receptor [Undibacterium sp. RTI2.2]MEB0232674.1 TonB-dependent receptor [Undibacterium sp. 10I3]MEB0258626.1 TonB-dependent receptor [Undibacterium sp. 5I1]
MPKPTIKLSLLAIAVATAFPMHAAMAQTAPASTDAKTDPTKLETVIVTANRRSENIKEVPMSISAIKGEALDTYNAAGMDIRFLASRVPSLNIESDFGRTFPRFYIRGLGNTDFDLNASQPVGLIYDDVVQESPILKGFPVFDVDQVEVLRGPQGTLFGRNSPAGVVKFESTKPTGVFEGYGNAGFGNYGAVNLEGAVNVPLNSDWALRVSGQSQTRDDRVTNPRSTGTKTLEGYDDKAARIQLAYKNSGFSALFNVHGRDMSGNATLFRANIIQKGTNNIVPGFDYSVYPTDGINKQTLNSSGASMRLRWDLDGMTLYSVTGYDKARVYSRADVDGGYGASFALPMGPGFIPFPSETADGIPDLKQITQEFRVQSNTKDPLQWIAGVYYFKEDIQVDSFDYNSLAGNVQDGYANQHQHSKSWATFGSLNYAVNDKLKLRGGVRYTSDKKDFDAQRFVTPGGGAGTAQLTAHPSSTNVSWDLGANYAADAQTNFFGRIATGYRAPSIQGRVLFGNDISVANPEKNLSFEAGVKKDILDNTARISATVFQYTVKDLQLTAGSGSVNQNKLVNADKATGQGFELELQANLNRNWKTTFGTSYNETEIKDAKLFVAPCGNGCTVTNPAGPVAGTVLIGGNPLPRAPKWVGNFTLKYTTPIANGDLYVFTDWAYKDTYNMFLYEAKEYTAKSLLEGGLRVGYKWGDGKYEVAAYGRNITNKQQVIAAIDFNNLTGILNEPRSYGIQLKANF